MPELIAAAPRSSPLAFARDVAQLAKPRLSALVIVTTAGGMWLAPGHLPAARALASLLGIAAVVGAANALNCWLEREVDGRMHRTRDRPLPAGRLEPAVALALGVAVPGFALPLLALVASPLTALLALVALVTYVAVYTPLKQRSSVALLAGAIPGALPPLLGWTAVTGRADPGGLALFGLLFAWQLPHFLAISLYLREDYARGRLRVFSLVHGERATRAAIAGSTLLLLPAALLPVALGVAGWRAGAVIALASAGLAAAAALGLGRRGERARWARGLFLATLAYLVVVMAALAAGARG